MKVSGTATLHAPRETVWGALHDPAVLVRTIPGCQRLEALADDSYAMTVTAGVASIQGLYDGRVHLAEPKPPDSYVLEASGAGSPGTVEARVEVRLVESGGDTRVDYAADAVVGGMVGGVGQRMLAAVAKRLAGQFFTAVDAVVTGTAPVAEPAAEAAAPELGGRVYEAPSAAVRGRPQGPPPFVQGAVVGAAAALVGAIVGGWISSRRRR